MLKWEKDLEEFAKYMLNVDKNNFLKNLFRRDAKIIDQAAFHNIHIDDETLLDELLIYVNRRKKHKRTQTEEKNDKNKLEKEIIKIKKEFPEKNWEFKLVVEETIEKYYVNTSLTDHEIHCIVKRQIN